VSRFAPQGMGAYVLKGAEVEHLDPGDAFVVELELKDIRSLRLGASGNSELVGAYTPQRGAAPTDFVVPVLEIKDSRGASHMFRTY